MVCPVGAHAVRGPALERRLPLDGFDGLSEPDKLQQQLDYLHLQPDGGSLRLGRAGA